MGSRMATSLKVMPKSLSTSAEMAQTYLLSLEQHKFYKENGYIVVKGLIDFSILYACKQRFIQICKGVVDRGNITVMKELSLINSGKTGEQLINKIQDILYDDVLCTYTENPRLLDVVSQLVGPNVTAMHSMLINKPPQTGRHPPHQDLYYFPFRPADAIVAAWTAIDTVTVDNGCLYVVPGSHRAGTLYKHDYPPPVKGVTNKMYHGIVDEDRVSPPHERVNLEMSPGDTAFFHPLLVHGSGPNTTQGYRKSISCHYASSHCHYIDVRGTAQQNIAKEIEEVSQRRGIPLSFNEIWQYRAKQVKGVKCNL